MSIPFGIYNSSNVDNIINSTLQVSTYSYTFNNTPADSIIYPQLISGKDVKNKICCAVSAYASFDNELKSSNPLTDIEFSFLNNLNKNEVPKLSIANNTYSNFNPDPSGSFGYNSMANNNENNDLRLFPYLALKVTLGTITSGTIIIKVLTFP